MCPVCDNGPTHRPHAWHVMLNINFKKLKDILKVYHSEILDVKSQKYGNLGSDLFYYSRWKTSLSRKVQASMFSVYWSFFLIIYTDLIQLTETAETLTPWRLRWFNTAFSCTQLLMLVHFVIQWLNKHFKLPVFCLTRVHCYTKSLHGLYIWIQISHGPAHIYQSQLVHRCFLYTLLIRPEIDFFFIHGTLLSFPDSSDLSIYLIVSSEWI